MEMELTEGLEAAWGCCCAGAVVASTRVARMRIPRGRGFLRYGEAKLKLCSLLGNIQIRSHPQETSIRSAHHPMPHLFLEHAAEPGMVFNCQSRRVGQAEGSDLSRVPPAPLRISDQSLLRTSQVGKEVLFGICLVHVLRPEACFQHAKIQMPVTGRRRGQMPIPGYLPTLRRHCPQGEASSAALVLGGSGGGRSEMPRPILRRAP